MEDAERLSPFKDDKPKDDENLPLEASLLSGVKAKVWLTKRFVCCIIIKKEDNYVRYSY